MAELLQVDGLRAGYGEAVVVQGISLALVLPVEDHLGQRNRQDRQHRRQDVGLQPEGKPRRADDDHAELRERIGGDIGYPRGNLAADPLELLRYRSNLLGADLRITNFGGGNTSSKIDLPDPLTGERGRVRC